MRMKYELEDVEGEKVIKLGDAVVEPFEFTEIDFKELNRLIVNEMKITFVLAQGEFDIQRLITRIVTNYLAKNQIVKSRIGE